MKLDLAADHRRVEPHPGIERRQRDRNALLDVVDAEALEGPAGERDIGIRADPLEIEKASQLVVAGDVILAGDSLVRRDTKGAGQAPQGIELCLAVAFKVTAEPAPLVGIVVGEIRILTLAVGDEAADLEGSDPVELAVARLDRGQGARIEMRGDGEVAVGRELPVIRDGELKAIAAAEADVGNQEPANASAAIAAGADAKDGQ